MQSIPPHTARIVSPPCINIHTLSRLSVRRTCCAQPDVTMRCTSRVASPDPELTWRLPALTRFSLTQHSTRYDPAGRHPSVPGAGGETTGFGRVGRRPPPTAGCDSTPHGYTAYAVNPPWSGLQGAHSSRSNQPALMAAGGCTCYTHCPHSQVPASHLTGRRCRRYHDAGSRVSPINSPYIGPYARARIGHA